MGVSWCLSLFRSANIPALDTCLLKRLKADSIPSFSPTVTCVKIINCDYVIYTLTCDIGNLHFIHKHFFEKLIYLVMNILLLFALLKFFYENNYKVIII